MPEQTLHSLEDLGKLVFSTHTHKEAETQEPLPSSSNQYLEAHFSKKGRNGKTVTLIKGFQGTEKELSQLAKYLKNQCGVGGTVKNGEILIQGNHREKIMEILKKEGYHVKRIGG